MTKSSRNGIGRVGRGNGNGNGNVGYNNGNNNTRNNKGSNNVGANRGNNGDGSPGKSGDEDPIDLDVLTILRTLDIDFTGDQPAGGPRKRRLKTPGHDETKH
jgi:hypothetical protein